MSDTVREPAAPHIYRVFSALKAVATLVGNVIPLYGVLYWQWDTFQLLMLYWMETAILAFWTLKRLSRLTAGERGEITVNRKARPASQFDLVGFFTLHAGLFITVHLILLWAFFSYDWLKKVHGVGSFFFELLVANYVWVGLVFVILASAVAFLVDSAARQPQAAGTTEEGSDQVGPIVAGLYVRIVIMQVAIIFGALISGFVGSMAPLAIVIVLKTLIDLGMSGRDLLRKDLKLSFKTGKVKVET